MPHALEFEFPERLLAIRGQLSDATSEWNVLSYILDLLKPFTYYVHIPGYCVIVEEYTTICTS